MKDNIVYYKLSDNKSLGEFAAVTRRMSALRLQHPGRIIWVLSSHRNVSRFLQFLANVN